MTIGTGILRSALRDIRRHPAYSAFAIAALAVAIGGSALLFSLYDAIALRPLPVDRPDELVSIRDLSVDRGGRSVNIASLSLSDFESLRDGSRAFAAIGAYAAGGALLRIRRLTVRADVQWVDPGYFEVLGVSARRGRTFVPEDDRRHGGAGGVVLTDATWSRLFLRDPAAVGEMVEIDGVARPILGVLPAGFQGFEVATEPGLFTLASDAPSSSAAFRLFGRRRPGVSRSRLQARLAGILAAIRAAQPGRQGFMIVDGKSAAATERVEVVEGRRGESELRGESALPLALVGGLFALVLVVLAANLANLLAVRALSGRGEAAIRMALGAPRALVAAGWFAESLLLTFAGAALGMLGIALGGSLFLRWAPLPAWVRGLTPAVDGRTLAVAASIAILVGLAVGGLAAWEQSRVAPALRLREEGISATLSRGGMRWRNALIASQVALSVVLLVAMGLFVRSAAALLGIRTGFPLERVLAFSVDLPDSLGERAVPEIDRLRGEAARLPGVAGAGYSSTALFGGMRAYTMAAIEGYRPKSDEALLLNTVHVSSGFFSALALPLAAGRFPDPADRKSEPAPAMINRRFAERYFPGEDPLGRRLSFDSRRDWSRPGADDFVVVGVVDDRMMSDVREEPTPRLYVPPETGSASVVFYVRTTGAPQPSVLALERLARRLLPEAAVGPVQTLGVQRDRSLRRELLTRDLALVFGTLAAALAAMGLFAVLSYVIGERRRELGLRQALGATPGDLVRRVLADGLRPVFWGLAIGLGIAGAASRVAASQLYGVTPRDPVTFLVAIAAMTLVGLAACIPPALRASRTGPAIALRTR